MSIDPCDFATCGVNAQCISGSSTNGNFDCVCNRGFTGNPFSVCFSKRMLLELVINMREQEINPQKFLGSFVFIEGIMLC